MPIDVRRAATRPRTRTSWLESRHSFSFGAHYDPANTHHGVLLASNDDVVAPGAGFDPHPHRDTEVVTWVVHGSLRHEDSAGNGGVVVPGVAQRMSAGRGVVHSETNDAWRLTGGPAHATPVRFVQMWVVPDAPGADPGYEQRDVAEDLRSGSLVPVASGDPGVGAAIGLGNRHATLHAARLEAGGSVQLPDAPWLHVYVVLGAAELEGAGRLDEGDAARLAGGGGHRLTSVGRSEVLVWDMRTTIGAAA